MSEAAYYPSVRHRKLLPHAKERCGAPRSGGVEAEPHPESKRMENSHGGIRPSSSEQRSRHGCAQLTRESTARAGGEDYDHARTPGRRGRDTQAYPESATSPPP